MFQTKVVEKIKTHILCLVTFFENRAVYEIMWKNTVEPDRPIGDNVAHAHCILVPKATDTISICNADRFSTATIATRTHLNVMLYLHCLFCLVLKI
jgi:hypothetical protein